MPGIVGIISNHPPNDCQRLVKAMVESMTHGQHIASGLCTAPEIGVYGGWIAHEGSFAARQSAFAGPKELSLLFSGECFTPFQPSKAMDSHGFPVDERELNYLLDLYDRESDAFVAKMNGLFSGLLIDRKKKRALLFNDRYGMERIYHHEKDGIVYFASEAKALLRVLPELRAFDEEGVAQFLSYGCTLSGRTLFQNVQLLPGGSYWIFDENANRHINHYFRPELWESQPELTEEAYELEFIETFSRILPKYFSPHTPVGVSLTGGLDSRMIMACIPNDVVKPVCYTYSGSSERLLDARLAARIAQTCGSEHHVLRIGKDFLSNYGHYVDRTVFVTDGCAGPLTAHEIYYSELARQLSQIRLTGNFGSEILRSVSTFKPINLDEHLFNSNFSPSMNSAQLKVLFNNENPVTFSAFREVPWNLYGSLAAGRSQLTFRTPYLDNEIVSLAYKAPMSSRLSANSALRLIYKCNISLGKIPTDRGIIWQGNPVYQTMSKLFSDVTFKLDYLHKEGLPDWLIPLEPSFNLIEKTGALGLHKFLPYRIWFKNELSHYLSEVVSSVDTQQLPYWDVSFLRTIVENHKSGHKNYIKEINAILTLEAVNRLLIKNVPS